MELNKKMILDHHIHVERTSIFENVHFLLKNSVCN